MNIIFRRHSDSPATIPHDISTIDEYNNNIQPLNQTITLAKNIHDIYNILFCLNRRHELQRLIQWAKSKRLKRPLKLYRSRLEDVERRLFRCQVTSPHLTTWAQALHLFQKLLNQAPRYLPHGSAKGYRYRPKCRSRA